ncbi:MAG TPA: PilN domain-containing protein [Gallionella sp.]|nr:PilN domain-containing protein [Gallionella sp.]
MTALSVIVSVVLFMSANRAREEIPMLEEQLARYRSRAVDAPGELPPRDKLAALSVQVKALKGLTGPLGQTLPQLLARIEGIVPDRVWLVSLEYRVREGEAKLVAEADQAELLTEFMTGLEQSGFFSQVLLTRQARRMEGAQTSVQFEIQLRGK